MIASRKIAHDGNPVLRWMASNVTLKQDSSGNFRPDKSKSADRIDGVVAMLMSLELAVRNLNTEFRSVYQDRGIIFL